MKSDLATVRKGLKRKSAGAVLTAPAKTDALGVKLRAAREKQGLTLRELARRVHLSPSLISQIERARVTPSVGTLWALTTELGLVIDALFNDALQSAPSSRQVTKVSAGRGHGGIQCSRNRKRIRLAGGVEWQRLTAHPDDDVEFLYITYEAGAESCPEHALFRHGGKEYAYILAGRLGVQVGFEKYELAQGDSISFNSQIPHRLWAIGDEPVTAICVVLNRAYDDRSGG